MISYHKKPLVTVYNERYWEHVATDKHNEITGYKVVFELDIPCHNILFKKINKIVKKHVASFTNIEFKDDAHRFDSILSCFATVERNNKDKYDKIKARRYAKLKCEARVAKFVAAIYKDLSLLYEDFADEMMHKSSVAQCFSNIKMQYLNYEHSN